MIVAIHQPQFLPYPGFFDKMKKADVFVLLDTVQFTKNEWHNRNRIKTVNGWQWLTVPVVHHFGQLIKDVVICKNSNWRKKHLQSLITNYCKAPYFKKYWKVVEEMYNINWERLSFFNTYWIHKLKQLLQIDTKIYLASELGTFVEDPNDRLIQIVNCFDGDTYLSGIGGKNYLKLYKFEAAKINVVFQKFNPPTYSQQFEGFLPNLSIIDMLFNCGDLSHNFFKKEQAFKTPVLKTNYRMK